jgi:hypothetical protein
MGKPATSKATPPRKVAPSSGKVAEPRILGGGNPQIAKGEGDVPVQAYIAAIPDDWKRDIARRVDAIVTRAVPGVRKAVKWNSPFYGAGGDEGWFLSLHCFPKYVKVSFFKGSELKPLPPGSSKWPTVRYLDVREGGLDDKQFALWVKQASKIPGWVP